MDKEMLNNDKYIIDVQNVSKTFRWQKKYTGFTGPIKNLVSPQYESAEVVKNLSLQIKAGESVAFLGPNGAGKSTTIKMICGILKPTMGQISVMGKDSWQYRPQLVKDMGVCFGNKSQLWWNLPVFRTYELLKSMYSIPDEIYNENIRVFSETLGIDKYLDKPVRQLSFGQKMKAEFAACMLHNPQLVLLDEPTIGLDIIARQEFANFIKRIMSERKTTVMLCTHDLNEVENICSRVVIINHGQIVNDTEMQKLHNELSQEYKMYIEYDIPIMEISGNDKISVSGASETHRDFIFNIDLRKISIDEAINFARQFGVIKFMELKRKEISEIIATYYRQ